MKDFFGPKNKVLSYENFQVNIPTVKANSAHSLIRRINDFMLSSSATCRLNSETSRVYLILVLVFVRTFAVCMLGQTVFQLVDFLCASIVFHPVIINKFV